MAEEMDIDQWLDGGQKYEKKTFLEKWQKRPGRKLNLFLHTKARPIEFYRHSFYRIVDVEDKDTKVKSRKIWFCQLNCHEELMVNRKQNKRDDEGNRTSAPQHCPMCMLSEWVRGEVNAGRLSWTDPVFSFQAPDDSRIIRAGALYNAFGGDKLTSEQKADLLKHDIKPSEAWKENHVAKGAVALCVVDMDNVDKGVQVAIETPLVSDCIRKVIRDTRESLGDTEGHPVHNPYCIQLEYKEKEPVFNKKYEARYIAKNKMTPEIEAQIRGTEAPDLSFIVAPFDAEALRAVLEKAALVKNIPFDKLFANAKKTEKREESTDEEKPKSRPQPAPASARQPPQKTSQPVTPPASKEAPSEELYECDTEGCAGLMKATDPTCTACKRVYIETPPPPPVAAAAPKKKRSELAATQPAPARKDASAVDDGADTGDEIPF